MKAKVQNEMRIWHHLPLPALGTLLDYLFSLLRISKIPYSKQNHGPDYLRAIVFQYQSRNGTKSFKASHHPQHKIKALSIG